MGLNMDAIRARLDKFNEGNRGGNGGGTSYYNIKDGRNVVRLMPPRKDAESFEREVFVHYGVGKNDQDKKGKQIVCPTTHGEDKACPICEQAKQLFNLSKKKGDKYEKEAKQINRKKRVYYNVISRDENLDDYTFKDGKWFKDVEGKEVEESPVKVLNTGIGVLQAIFGIIVDPEYGDITDPEEGLDLIITRSGSGLDTKYEVKTVRKETPIGLDNWEEGSTDLSVFARPKTYKEILAMANGETATDTDEEEEDETPAKPTKSTETVEEDTDTDTDTDGDDAGDDDTDEAIEAALRRRQQK